MSDHRLGALQSLTSAIEKMGTPPAITQSIIHGIKCWTTSQSDTGTSIRAPTRGSVRAADVILTQAFVEQTNTIGWEQFLRGIG